MSDNIGVTLSQNNLQMNPGETAEIAITIKNTSNVVDVFSVEVVDLDSSWCEISVVQSSLFPGDEAATSLTIKPPKVSASLAQSYPFAIRATSQKDSTQNTEAAATLLVHPFYSFDLDLHPRKATGPKGIYGISITNTGNAELNVGLEGRDPEDLCQFQFESQRPRIPAGERVDAALQVDPSKRPLRGRPRGYRFELTASPDPGTAEPVSIAGELEATARIPSGLARMVSFLFRRRRRPTAFIPGFRSGSATGAAESAAGSVKSARRPPKWMLWAGASLILVLLVAVGAFFLAPRGAPDFQGPFLLNPGDDLTFSFSLPEAVPTRVEATAEWEGTAEELAITFHQPDGSKSGPLRVLDGSPLVFGLNQEAVAKGTTGWLISIENNTASGQAEGTVSLSFSELR